MGLLHEFKQFVLKGNAVDMGVGVVLGAAFSSLVDSLVKDILIAPLSMLYAKFDIKNLYISLDGNTYASLEAAKEAGAATINLGNFMSSVIRFLIIVFVVFLVIRQVNRWKKPHRHPMDSMTKKECPYCCMPIPSRATVCPNCSSTIEKTNPSGENNLKKSPKWYMK